MGEVRFRDPRGILGNLKAFGRLYLHAVYALYLDSPLLSWRGNQIAYIGKVWNLLAKWFPETIRIFPGYSGLTVLRWGRDVELTDGLFVLKLKKNYAIILFKEILAWERWYGEDRLMDKTVMDAGAGCGETLWWFARQGARNFIAIEPDPTCIPYLEENARLNGWQVTIINEILRPEHLKIPHDFVKIDVEGGEKVLLDGSVEKLGRCIIEMHPPFIGDAVCQRIVEKFKLRSLDGRWIYGS